MKIKKKKHLWQQQRYKNEITDIKTIVHTNRKNL